MRKVAITGGRGRLAPLIAENLRKRGNEVTAFSRSEGGGFRDVTRLLDKEQAAAFDVIIHLGWSTVPLTSEKHPGAEEKSDLPFLEALLTALAGISRSPHLVFPSTAAVYGNCDQPATEETICRPLGRYAAAKLRAEDLIRETAAAHPHVRACILRISNVFGFPDHTSKPQGIVPRLCAAAHTDAPLTIWGDGTATKDYLFSDDFHEALQAVLDHRLDGTFNVASGQSLSLCEIIALVEAISGRKLLLKEGPHFAWDVEHTLLSAELLFTATGWRARQHVPAAIEKLIREELS